MTSNYIPPILWDVTICLCLWYLFLVQESSYILVDWLGYFSSRVTLSLVARQPQPRPLLMHPVVNHFYATIHTTIGLFANASKPSAAYLRQWNMPLLQQIMARRLIRTKPLFEAMLLIMLFEPIRSNRSENWTKYKVFFQQNGSGNAIWKCRPFNHVINMLNCTCTLHSTCAPHIHTLITKGKGRC